jgi:hypothetical protein
MAIAPDILLAIFIDKNDNSHSITLENTNSRFPRREIRLDAENPFNPVTIDSTTLGITYPYARLSKNGATTSKPAIWVTPLMSVTLHYLQ